MNISDFVVSSYTTNLSTLIRSAPKHHKQRPRVLAVSQPNATGYVSLPGTITEVDRIKLHIDQQQFCHLNASEATVDAVLEQMQECNYVHLACHGIQDAEKPLECAFVLHDGNLRLERLMAQSLKNVDLAVLSACQTATGDKTLPEEAVHLAGGMLSVGYPSVIATMWSINDADGPIVADKLYAHLFKDQGTSTTLDRRLSPAYALHEALKHLRGVIDEKNFERWVPFVHFGI